MKHFLSAIVFVSLLAACQQQTTTMVNDTWLGKWNGPEGTFLNIEAEEGGYSVIIQDLDGPKSYHGVANADGIAFDRNNVTEVIHPGNGVQTGMKWLSDKKECLIVKTGEGFCRD